MKKLFYGFAMCQSMFCAIPFPWNLWDEKARGKMLLFLPVIGLEIGLLWVLLLWGCRVLELPALVAGLLLAAFPYLITGFIHLDGFMDVTDAVKSCCSLERRREILKDSHVGAFAVIGCILLMLAQFALFASLKSTANLWILALIPVVSRCCAALAVTILPPMTTSQYANNERPISHVVMLCILLVAAIGAGFLFCGIYGLVLLGGLAGYAAALCRGYRSLKGMNGDISGYALTLSELAAVAVFVLI